MPPALADRARRERFLRHAAGGLIVTGWDDDGARVVSAVQVPHDGSAARHLTHTDPATPAVLAGSPDAVIVCTDAVAGLRRLTAAAKRGQAPTLVCFPPGDVAAALDDCPAAVRDLIVAAGTVDLPDGRDAAALRLAVEAMRDRQEPGAKG